MKNVHARLKRVLSCEFLVMLTGEVVLERQYVMLATVVSCCESLSFDSVVPFTVVWRRSKPTVTQVFLTAIVVPLNKRACISSHSSRFLLRPLLIFTIYSSSSSSALLSSYFWISRAIFFLPFVYLFASRSLSLNYLLFLLFSLFLRFHSSNSVLSCFSLSLLSLFYLCSILFSSFLAFTLLSPFPRFSFQFLSCSLCLFSSFLKYCRFLRFFSFFRRFFLRLHSFFFLGFSLPPFLFSPTLFPLFTFPLSPF